MSERKLLATVTGEPFQPSRIHYELYDKVRLNKIFSSQTFMDYDRSLDRWVWLYTGKAKKLVFGKPWRKIPKQFHPIVIGSFFQRTPGAMFLEVRSIKRAIAAIVFFDRIIPRGLAKVTDISIVNRLFDATPDAYNLNSPLDHLFANEKVINPEAWLDDITNRMEKSPIELATQSGAKELLRLLEEESSQHLAEVERFPSHYYEDGIEALTLSLTTRETIAFEHWKGNTNFSFRDIIQF